MDVRVTWDAGTGTPRVSYHKVDRRGDVYYSANGVRISNAQSSAFYAFSHLIQVEVTKDQPSGRQYIPVEVAHDR
jgi:hypothetical protein